MLTGGNVKKLKLTVLRRIDTQGRGAGKKTDAASIVNGKGVLMERSGRSALPGTSASSRRGGRNRERGKKKGAHEQI